MFHQQSRLLQESSRSRGGLDEMLIGERAAFAQGSVQNFKEQLDSLNDKYNSLELKLDTRERVIVKLNEVIDEIRAEQKTVLETQAKELAITQ